MRVAGASASTGRTNCMAIAGAPSACCCHSLAVFESTTVSDRVCASRVLQPGLCSEGETKNDLLAIPRTSALMCILVLMSLSVAGEIEKTAKGLADSRYWKSKSHTL